MQAAIQLLEGRVTARKRELEAAIAEMVDAEIMLARAQRIRDEED